MTENDVKIFAKKWLLNQSDVSNVLPEQKIIQAGLIADFVAYASDGEIKYIIECKGSADIGEIAKGLGQVYQYNFQKQFNKKARNAEVYFICPRDRELFFKVLRIPKDIKILLVDDSGKILERKPSKSPHGKIITELQLPNTFYIRDIYFEDIKVLIKVIDSLTPRYRGDQGIPRRVIMSEAKKQRPQMVAEGYNHLITLMSLGFINSQNMLTPEGYKMLGYIERSENIFYRELMDRFYTFIINVLNALIHIAKDKNQTVNKIVCTQKEISSKINELWGDQVRFLYDPRTISTVIRILEELKLVKRNGDSYSILSLCHAHLLPWVSGQGKDMTLF